MDVGEPLGGDSNVLWPNVDMAKDFAALAHQAGKCLGGHVACRGAGRMVGRGAGVLAGLERLLATTLSTPGQWTTSPVNSEIKDIVFVFSCPWR